jgi:uncharacterized protein YhfF
MEEFRVINPDTPKNYVVWAFGYSKETANELAKLVLEGTKTATASNYTLYELGKSHYHLLVFII